MAKHKLLLSRREHRATADSKYYRAGELVLPAQESELQDYYHDFEKVVVVSPEGNRIEIDLDTGEITAVTSESTRSRIDAAFAESAATGS